jgi:hypothetical protein
LGHIHSINTKEDYRMEILLDNGSSISLNFKNRLRTIRFSLLADPGFFALAVTDGSFIRWGNKVEISLSELFELARK